MMTPGMRTLPAIIHVPRGSSDLGTGLANGSLGSQGHQPIGMVLKSAPSAPGHLPVAEQDDCREQHEGSEHRIETD